MFDYDAELRRYHSHLMRAADIAPDSRVLDVGCGTGRTTRDAARAAPHGRALGIDSSVSALGMTTDLLSGQDDATASRALARLHRALDERANHDGVWFDSAAWLVTAHRRDGRGRAVRGR